METDICITRKTLLKKVTKNQEIITLLKNTVIKMNKITILTYQLIKLYYLYNLKKRKKF